MFSLFANFLSFLHVYFALQFLVVNIMSCVALSFSAQYTFNKKSFLRADLCVCEMEYVPPFIRGKKSPLRSHRQPQSQPKTALLIDLQENRRMDPCRQKQNAEDTDNIATVLRSFAWLPRTLH